MSSFLSLFGPCPGSKTRARARKKKGIYLSFNNYLDSRNYGTNDYLLDKNICYNKLSYILSLALQYPYFTSSRSLELGQGSGNEK